MTPPTTEARRLDPLAVLRGRGLSDETFARFGIKPTERGVRYPVRGRDGAALCWRFKSLDGGEPKYLWHDGVEHNNGSRCIGPNVVYGFHELAQPFEGPLWVVEGEPDLWTAHQEGLAAVTALGGAQTVKDEVVATIAKLSRQVRTVYDNDGAGRAGAETLATKLTRAGVRVTIVQLPGWLGEGGDLNDLLIDFRAKRQILRIRPSGSGDEPPILTHDLINLDGLRLLEDEDYFARAAADYTFAELLEALAGVGEVWQERKSPPAALGSSLRLARPAPEEPAGVDSAGQHFTAEHGVYVASWGDPVFVEIELDRFEEARDGLKAEVVIRSTVPGLERQLARQRVPLLGTRAIGDLVRHLDDSMRERKLPWRELIGTAFEQAIRAHREGEPARLLSETPARQSSRYALAQLALLDLPTFAWAKPEQGKTWLAVGVACALATGRRDLLGIEPARPLEVGYLDWELTQQDVDERARMFCGGRSPEITYIACRSALWDELDRIVRIVRERKLEYLVIESAGMACGGLPPESSEAALKFMTVVRRLGLGAFVTAHVPKDGSEAMPFGSIYWFAQLRLGWRLQLKQELGSPDLKLAAYCEKSSTDRRPAPLAWRVSFGAAGVRFERRDVRDEPELAKGLSLRWRLQHALRGGSRTIVDLAEELEESADTVTRTLHRYERGKAVEHFLKVPGPDGLIRWANLAAEMGA